jgi:hypothetical protein
MRNKDLYYKKYLKYKNKYLNLRNLIGGSPPPPPLPKYNQNGLFLIEHYHKNGTFSIDEQMQKETIYSIIYNHKYRPLISGNGNAEYIKMHLNRLTHIHIVKLNNLFNLYKSYGYMIHDSLIRSFPSHITKLIFDDNQLSDKNIINIIIMFIKKFEMLSSLSFKSCSLTEESATYLLAELKNLGKIFIEIDLSNNDLSQETKNKFNEIKNKIIIESNVFLVEELKKPNITTIKLENVIPDIIPKLNGDVFMNIMTLIFDGNDLSTIDNVNLIVSIIKIFKNVSSLSFKSCSLTEESAKYLQQELKKLGKTFTEIDLSDNDGLSQETKDNFLMQL